MGVTEQPQGSLGVTTILDVTGTPAWEMVVWVREGHSSDRDPRVRAQDTVRGSLVTVIFVIAQHRELPLLASLSPE